MCVRVHIRVYHIYTTCIIYTQHVYIHTYVYARSCDMQSLRYAIKLPSPEIHPLPPTINQIYPVLKLKHPVLCVLPIKIRVMYIYMYTYMYIYIHIYVFVAIQRTPFATKPSCFLHLTHRNTRLLQGHKRGALVVVDWRQLHTGRNLWTPQKSFVFE